MLEDKTHTQPLAAAGTAGHSYANRLGSFLCWAVVFADIGTSVYYTPGILFGQYERLAGFFVFLTLSVFVLLTLKYSEVTERFPEGGGVVTVSARAIGPWAGALGGMLILVDYFLTASLSSLSGLTYFEVVWPGLRAWVLWATVGVLVILGLLNWWGIKESATVSAVVAMIALLSDLVVLAFVFAKVPPGIIVHTFGEMFSGRRITGPLLITGFAGAFLAFSGLESISQLSPVMRVPRKRVAGVALALVAVTVGITSPLLTVFSTTLVCSGIGFDPSSKLYTCLTAPGKPAVDPNQFISALGGAYGGAVLGIAVAISASALLVFASNTAIIGSYHVFLALTRMRFFPPIVGRYNHFRETPHVAIFLATIIPIAILIFSQGAIDLLGDMYAFGLLGAFSLTCLGLDIVRVRERRGDVHIGPTPREERAELRAQDLYDELTRAQAAERGPVRLALATSVAALQSGAERATEPLRREPLAGQFERVRMISRPYLANLNLWLGFLTTLLVFTAWCTNIINKPLATEFGGGVTAVGLAIAWANHRRMEREGKPAVYPSAIFRRMPDALLVVLPPGVSEEAQHAREILVRAAAEHADDRPLIFLYLAPAPQAVASHLMEITDPYGRDVEAQQAFSQVASIFGMLGIPRRQQMYVYRAGKRQQIADVWRVVRPDATVALADQGLARIVQPLYVRFYDHDRERVAFYVHRGSSATGGPTAPGASSPANARPPSRAAGPGVAAGVARPTPAPATRGPAEPATNRESPSRPGQPPDEETGRHPAAQPTAPTRASEQPPEPPSDDLPAEPRTPTAELLPPDALAEADQYVWTGTELKRREEVEEDTPPKQGQQPSRPSRPSQPRE